MSDVTLNGPDLWQHLLPSPSSDDHKYSRGSALIRGGLMMTGASRLSARAAQRMGAGLVTLAAPAEALAIYAEALESVIVKVCDDTPTWQAMVGDAKARALLLGPGMGHGDQQKEDVYEALATKRPIVLDADALTLFADTRHAFFKHLHTACVLTPHEGEAAKLFPELPGEKEARARAAAQVAGCVVLLKGARTYIADPEGRLILNTNAPPWLATAGSGDVLAGMILGLLAQKMDPFKAAAAAAWIHGACAAHFGLGLIAEDIVAQIPALLQVLGTI